jgi:hypothetical protein
VEPQAPLSSRVVEAIAAPREPRATGLVPRLAGATLLALVLAGSAGWYLVSRPDGGGEATARREPLPTPTSAAATPLASAGTSDEPSLAGDVRRWAARDGLARAQRVTRGRLEPWIGLPALESPAPLQVQRIDADLIAADTLAIEPLSVPLIEVESLDR